MCLIAFAWLTREDRPLVLASNRDEFFNRPTALADWWQPQPGGSAILGGRDLQAGGTWMGVTRTGRFAALTNFRAPNEKNPLAPSRGPLVSDFLASTVSPKAYLETLAQDAAGYNGFSLLAGDLASKQLWLYSNRSGYAPQALGPGIYGLSNALLDTPWPKLLNVRDRLRKALAENSPDLVPHLLAVMDDPSLAPEWSLPATGIDPYLEKILSAIFILPAVREPGGAPYGTRTSTVLSVAAGGHATYYERNFDADLKFEDHGFAFEISRD